MSRAGANRLQLELRGIRLGRADRSVFGEVVTENVRVFADVAKVNGSASALEQQKSVKVFKE